MNGFRHNNTKGIYIYILYIRVNIRKAIAHTHTNPHSLFICDIERCALRSFIDSTEDCTFLRLVYRFTTLDYAYCDSIAKYKCIQKAAGETRWIRFILCRKDVCVVLVRTHFFMVSRNIKKLIYKYVLMYVNNIRYYCI